MWIRCSERYACGSCEQRHLPRLGQRRSVMFGTLFNLVATVCGLASKSSAGRHVAAHSAAHTVTRLFKSLLGR